MEEEEKMELVTRRRDEYSRALTKWCKEKKRLLLVDQIPQMAEFITEENIDEISKRRGEVLFGILTQGTSIKGEQYERATEQAVSEIMAEYYIKRGFPDIGQEEMVSYREAIQQYGQGGLNLFNFFITNSGEQDKDIRKIALEAEAVRKLKEEKSLKQEDPTKNSKVFKTGDIGNAVTEVVSINAKRKVEMNEKNERRKSKEQIQE